MAIEGAWQPEGGAWIKLKLYHIVQYQLYRYMYTYTSSQLRLIEFPKARAVSWFHFLIEWEGFYFF